MDKAGTRPTDLFRAMAILRGPFNVYASKRKGVTMLRFGENTAPRKDHAAGRVAVEAMEGRVLMSGTPIGSPVTFTYVVHPGPASADYASADSPATFTPDGRRLVVAYKGGPEA